MNRTAPTSNPDAFQFMLKESIDRFLTEYSKGTTDFSNFTSIFSRFMQNLPDPPLELVWFYSALTFHSAKLTTQDSSNKVSIAKDLFQLLISCASPYNAVKNIAALAPVVYELYSLIFDKKETRKEIERVLEVIVSYISICCSTNFDESEGFGGLSACFADLVRVWLVEKVGEKCKFGENLRVFYPVISDRVHEGIREGCGLGCLAGIVMSEAFLLRLCLKFGAGISRVEFVKELRNLAVQMMTAFRSYYFFDNLLKMLLEPILPVISILNSENEVLLREVLYDAVLTMEYSFLSTQKGIQPPDRHLKNLAVTWLFVADNAIRSVRESGDQTKVISYAQAFSQSCLLSHLIEWVTNQTGMQTETCEPNLYTPAALIKWLLIAEDQGVRVFDSNISKIYAKAIICKSRVDYDLLVVASDGNNLGRNHFSYPMNGRKREDKVDGDLQMVDTICLATPGLMELTALNCTRKRKEGRRNEGDKQVKFVKCHLNDGSLKKVLPLGDGDGLSSGSEVDIAVCDEVMEHMEQ